MEINSMNKVFVYSAVSFIAGASAGVALGMLLCKKKYENYADQEIKKIRTLYMDHLDSLKESNNGPKQHCEASPSPVGSEQEVVIKNDKEAIEYSKKYRSKEGDSAKIIDSSTLDDGNKDKYKHIIVISPDQFYASEYDAQTLWYFKDKILADNDNNVIHVPEEVVGDQVLVSFEHFAENEEGLDTAYVRDEKLKIDYEIIYSQLTFEEHMQRERDHEMNTPKKK